MNSTQVDASIFRVRMVTEDGSSGQSEQGDEGNRAEPVSEPSFSCWRGGCEGCCQCGPQGKYS